MPQNNNICYEEDEIDLRELFKTIAKYKVFIAVFTTVVTLGALAYAFSKTPMYEAKALVEIGSYKVDNYNANNNNKALLDDTFQLVKVLNVLYIDMYKNVKDKKASVESITIPKKSKGFIEIKSLAVSNDLAVKSILKIVEYIQQKNQKVLDDVKQRREFEIKNLDVKIDDIKKKEMALLSKKISLKKQTLKGYENQLKLIDENIKKIENTKPTLVALELMEKRDLSATIMNLNMQIMDMINKENNLETTVIANLKERKKLLESMLLPHNYKNTAIVGEVITNDYPVKPKKKLIVIVSFVTGLILSIFLVFFIEFIRNEKEESSK